MKKVYTKKQEEIYQLFLKYKKRRNMEYIKRLGISSKDLEPDYNKKLAIIVPYRDNPEQNRKKQLEIFTTHVNKMFEGKNWSLYVIEQSDDGKKFNKGALLNIGITMALKDGCKLLATNDVDLLPQSDLVPFYFLYSIYHPIHLGHVWQDKYKYREFVGGIILLSDFCAKKINGFPNNFWGWGGEDDALYDRILANNFQIYEPLDGKIVELKHIHTYTIKKYVNNNKKENLLKDLLYWKENGLFNVKFEIKNKQNNIYTVIIKK